VTPVVAFFNNKGGVGKTTLTYHLAWMLRRLGVNVLAVDLDPQANLTSAFVDDEIVEQLWRDEERKTVYGAIAPLIEGEGGVADPYVHEIEPGLWLVPGDLLLSGTEQELSTAWPNAGDGHKRAFRVLTSFAAVATRAATACEADVVLVDVGPNLGAINRAAMVAADYVIVPLSPDLYSLQGLRNLGPTLRTWRQEWNDRKGRAGDLWVPDGGMQPVGYVVLQHAIRLDRVVGAYDRWLRRVPAQYRGSVLGEDASGNTSASDDPNCLGLMKHYHSLVPMAQEARRPIFLLRSADGAIGAHQKAVLASYQDFGELARRIMVAIGADGLMIHSQALGPDRLGR
jgi:cellulose biosynthesis protein BcsQ